MPADFFAFLSTSRRSSQRRSAGELFEIGARDGRAASRRLRKRHPKACLFQRRLPGARRGTWPRRQPREHDIEVALTDRAVLELIDGKCSLQQSVVQGEIHIKGESVVLDRYYRCLSHYLNGALRSASFPTLLSQYRSAVSSSG